MNMQQILNDPELLEEFEKAYRLSAPYREKVQYKLHLLQQCFFINDVILFWKTDTVLAISSLDSPFIHPDLKV